jgi:hypothetical protein
MYYIPNQNFGFSVEIVMNEMQKLMKLADSFANTSHDICRCPEV